MILRLRAIPTAIAALLGLALLGGDLPYGGAAPLAAQATGQVTGRVMDGSTLSPLSDVQISIQGTGIGTLSAGSGRFLLNNVPAGEVTLVAQLIGYGTVERTVVVRAGEVTQVEIGMDESAIAIDEIVVTGTPAATSRRQIGNAISSVDAESIVEAAPISNVNELLTGRTSGALVATQSGNLGSGAPIRLRGDNSLSLSGQPIVYVDGIRVDANADDGGIFGHTGTSRLQDINPSDIQSVEILKGPAASTLYGTEASNGVIQIITKKGRPGDTQVSLSVEQGANWFRDAVGRVPDNCDRDSTGQMICQNLIADERALGNEVFRTGHLQTYNLSVRGGEGNVGYFVSGKLEDHGGLYKNNSINRKSFRANVNTSLWEQLDLGVNLGYVTSENPRHPEGFSNDQGIIANLLFATPLQRDTPLRGWFRATPEESYEIDTQQDINRFTWSVQANHEPADWLTQRLNAGIDVVDQRNIELWPRQPEGASHFFGSRGLGQKEVEEIENRTITLDYATTASRDLFSGVNSATSAGFQYFTTERSLTYAFAREFPAPAVTTVSAAAVTSSEEEFVENSTVGVYLQERFSFNDRLFLTGAVRGDDNSAFGQDFDFVIYPKVSGSWSISQEDFWDVSWVEDLRVRAAWGQAGQQPSAFAAVRTFAPITGANDQAGFLPNNPGNPGLEPEKGSELEVGFDASLIGGRVALDFTYYDQTKTDAIVSKDVAPSSGFPGSQFVNLGEIQNRGFELQVDTRPWRSRNVVVNLGGNAAYNTNEIIELGGPTINAGGFNTIFHREGWPLGAFFSKKVVQATRLGDGEYTDILCDGGTGKDGLEPGGPAVPCDDAPPIFRGQPGPKWSGAVNASVTLFGDLRLTASSDFRLDQHQFSITTFGRDAVFRNTRKVNDPQGQAAINDLAEWDAVGSAGPWVENHSFVSMRELAATYTIPEAIASDIFRASRATLRVGLRNLGYFWIHEDFTDLDPDVHRGGSTIIKSQQTLTPLPTRFVSSLSVTF